MELDEHWMLAVQDAFALANAVGPAFAHGKPLPSEPTRSLPEVAVLGDTGRELWMILRAVAAGDTAAAAERLNALLDLMDARPRMARRGPGGFWHLQFVSSTGGESTHLVIATGMLLGSGDFVRIKGCQAPRCERVFLDSTRNRSQQFCSTRCQDRVKTASLRERRRAREDTPS
ncbi:CGNR zinc finger domain-containing protein [Winogradskya humida]|nr:CGNR zinc finger domain-containing protein [Actinoplanes humidus]